MIARFPFAQCSFKQFLQSIRQNLSLIFSLSPSCDGSDEHDGRTVCPNTCNEEFERIKKKMVEEYEIQLQVWHFFGGHQIWCGWKGSWGAVDDRCSVNQDGTRKKWEIGCGQGRTCCWEWASWGTERLKVVQQSVFHDWRQRSEIDWKDLCLQRMRSERSKQRKGCKREGYFGWDKCRRKAVYDAALEAKKSEEAQRQRESGVAEEAIDTSAVFGRVPGEMSGVSWPTFFCSGAAAWTRDRSLRRWKS